MCKNTDELKQQLKEISSSFTPTLAFVFANVKCDIQQINSLLNSKNIEYIGCSTAGEIQNTNLAQDNICVLLMDLDKSYYSIEQNNYSNSVFEDAKTLGQRSKSLFENPGIIIFSGGIAVDGYKIVSGIKESINDEIPIFGGLGGNNLEFLKTNVYANDFNSENGYSAVVFNTDKIQLNGIAVSGWSGLGRSNTITKSEDNIVFEINGVPALDEIKKYFGEQLFDQPANASEDVITFPGQFPLQIQSEDGSSFLRAIVYVNLSTKALILAGSVPQGAKFKYCPNPDINVVTDTVDYYKEKLGNGENMDAVLMISCLIRNHAFGPLFEEEINSIYNLWKKPMAGFLSYGEIGNTGESGVVEFHNATCSLVSLHEVSEN